MSWKKQLIISSAAVAALILTAYLVLLSLDLNRFKPQIVLAVKEASGLEVAIHGDIKFGLGFHPNVVIHQIGIRNALWGSRPESVRVSRCEVKLSLLRMVRGILEIEQLSFIEPDFLLETNPSGEFNFHTTPPKSISPSRSNGSAIIPVRKVHVEKGRFTYRDGTTGRTFSKDVKKLELSSSNVHSPIYIDLEGSINETPVRMEGMFGSGVQLIDSEQSWPFELSAKLNGSSATLHGEITNVAGLKGLSLKVKAEGASFKEAIAMAGIQLPLDPGPFAFSALIEDAESKLMSKEIDLRVGTQEQGISISGAVADLLSKQGIRLNYHAQCQDLATLAGPLIIPMPIRGPFVVSGKIVGSAPKVFQFPDIHLSLGQQVFTGAAQVDTAGKVPRARVELATPELDPQSALISDAADSIWVRALRAMGPLSLSVSISDPYGKPVIEELDFHAGTHETAELKITGSVNDPLSLRGIEISYRLKGKDAGILKNLVGKSVPLKGPFVVSGSFADASRDAFAFDAFEVALGENRFSGKVELLAEGGEPLIKAKLSGRNLALKDILDTGLAGPRFVETLSALDQISVAFTMSDPIGRPQIHKANALIGSDDLALLRIQGSVRDLLTLQGIDLGFAVRGRNAAHLDRLFGRKIPLKGPFALMGRTRDTEPGKYRVEDLKAVLGENEIQGWAESKLSEDPLRIRAEFSSRSADLSILEPVKKAYGVAIRDLGPWSLKTLIRAYPDIVSVESLHFVLGTRDLAEVKATGAIHDLLAWQGVDLDCSLKGKNLSGVFDLTGVPLPLMGDFDISGRLLYPDTRTCQVRKFEARLGGNDISGSFDLDLRGERPKLDAEISSRNLDLRSIIAKPEITQEKKAQTRRTRDRVFPSDPLPLGYLELMNAKVRIKSGQVLLPRLALDNVFVDLAIRDGSLEMHPFHCVIGGGSVEGRFELKAGSREPAAVAVLDMRAERIDIGAMLDSLGAKKSVEGTLGAEIEVQTKGHSISSLMAGLNGRVVWVEREGRIYSRYMDVGGDLIRKIMSLVNPFSEKEEYSELHCGVHVFHIKDGLASCKISLTDTEYTILKGKGEVDLGEEKLNLMFGLSPKKGIGISGVAEIGVSIPGVARAFRVGGTLAQPSLTINPGGAAAGTIGKMLGGFTLLGPLGLAAGLLEVKVGEKDACNKVLKALEEGDYSLGGLEKDLQAEKPAAASPNSLAEEHRGP